MTTPSNDITSQLYSGAATFGHYYSIGILVLTGVIGIICVGVGIYFAFFKKQIMFTETTARVLMADCSLTGAGVDGPQYACNLQVAFGTIPPPNGTSTLITTKISPPVGNVKYQVGDNIRIFYDPDNPQNFSLQGSTWDNKMVAAVAVIGGLVIFAFGFLQYWIASASKAGSAAIGALGFWKMFG